MTDRFGVADTTAVVTGWSSGIGRPIVEPVARSITERDRSGRAIAVECDVTDRNVVGETIPVNGTSRLA